MQLRFGKIEPHASAVLGPDITDGTAYSGIPEIDVLGMSTKKERKEIDVLGTIIRKIFFPTFW